MTDEIIAETDSAITRFAQPARMNSSQYATKVVPKILRCKDVFESYALNEILAGGLEQSIRYGMCEYLGAMKIATLNLPAFYATSLLRLQGKDITFKSRPSASARQAATKHQIPHRKSSWERLKADVQNLESRLSSGQMAASRHCSGRAVMAIDSCTTPTDTLSSLITSMDLLSTIDSTALCRVCPQEIHLTSRCPFLLENQ